MRNIIHQTHTAIAGIALCALLIVSCSKNDTLIVTGQSASGKLLRYDVLENDYDVQPVTTFSMSYNQADLPVNLYEKAGQSLFSYSLEYGSNALLTKVTANNGGIQRIVYGPANKPIQINYTNLTDTGKVIFTYAASGKLTAVTDSLKQPLKLPVKYQYLFTYDAAGNNVTQIVKNQLDLQNRPTLRQTSYYTYDNKPNPFINFPTVVNSVKLPGEYAALVNRNNITEAKIVGVVYSPGGPGSGSTPILVPVDNYQSVRAYEYNEKGLPVKAVETFNNIQFNYKGSRTFTYDY